MSQPKTPAVGSEAPEGYVTRAEHEAALAAQRAEFNEVLREGDAEMIGQINDAFGRADAASVDLHKRVAALEGRHDPRLAGAGGPGAEWRGGGTYVNILGTVHPKSRQC